MGGLPTGRYVIVFNGEIYNHLLIRKELADQPVWRGFSDTETLLAGFDAWGIESTIKRTIGMFAFAVWDKQDHVLTLGRDRLGEKSLYYGWQQGSFLFGSELKALQAHPAFNAEIDRNSLALFMRHNTIPAPYCIWKGIHKLMPGCLLIVSRQNPIPIVSSYWSGKEIIEEGSLSRFAGSREDAVLALERLLGDAVERQMVADVPVGAFLSGGVDSSLIVALMQSRTSKPVCTFSIGYKEELYNEAPYAKAVAKHLGTEHTELYVGVNDALNVIPKLSTLYDEPFADSSQIPTFLVAQLAKQHVTVALSGDGGDELFGGYNRYLMVNQLWKKLSYLPLGLRRSIGKNLSLLSPSGWDRLSITLSKVLPKQFGMSRMGDKVHKASLVLAAQTINELYYALISHWDEPTNLVLGAVEPLTILTHTAMQPQTQCDIEYMMALDLLSYLPDDILTKVDRAAMGVSLETRIPFLDHNVVEFSCSLPLKHKIHNGVSKWPLREILYKYVPMKLIERPKMGFGVPVGSWLRESLRDWAEALLDEQRLEKEGYLDSKVIRKMWAEHLSGRSDWTSRLWTVLMFQAWLEAQS